MPVPEGPGRPGSPPPGKLPPVLTPPEAPPEAPPLDGEPPPEVVSQPARPSRAKLKVISVSNRIMRSISPSAVPVNGLLCRP